MKLSLGLALVAGLLLVSPVSLAADFDHDGDGDVDIFDVADFFACCDGPDLLVSGDCADSHDANSDLDVDLLDFGELQLDFGRMGSVLVERLTFTGSSFNNVKIDCPSGSCSNYGTPHWLDDNLDGDAQDYYDHKYPVAYTRDGTVTLTGLRFAVTPADLSLTGVPVYGSGPDGIFFEGTGNVSGGWLTVSGSVSAGAPLPDAVTFYNTFDIDWEVALDGVNFYPAGTSRNVMYVTYDDPLGGRFESYYHIATQAADGYAEEQDVIDAIWAEFADREVYNVRGERLGYYRDILCAGQCTYYTAQKLVYYTNSQCGGWADLMMECLDVQGIGGSEFVTIEPRGTSVIPPDCGTWPSGASGFIVKNYDFLIGASSGCANYPFRFNDPCGYYTSWSDPRAIDADGIPGQDNPNPASWFARHFIVKINLKYYDASYGAGPFTGTTEQATLTWETGAIDGYHGTAEASSGRLGVRKDIANVRETYFDR